ncbi:mitochondrial 54S ribosomal protein mL46 MRPL17 PWA37_003235 [Arxiozyma heterogenica]|uniref:Large ribosomal subunit protein mL46 n=1 Tax=Arxiozyma heterogenica TaxID=278026 RepID=A0AAN7WML8_9SACH|nr:hypothetical protein RI543_001717 [Kazachstania heterogenica]
MATKVPQTIRAALILARSPIVVPDLTKFESQYIKYKYELEKRLMWTFPAYYYFKKGTMSEYKFQIAQKKPISKQPGVWYPQGIPDIRHGRERSTKQEVIIPKDENPANDTSISRPVVKNSIITKADESNDTTSLERQLRKTLYLLVKIKPNDEWKFPSFEVNSDYALHEVAESGLRDIGGSKINTWTVSRKPVKVLKDKNDESLEFFIKSRILTGEFVPKMKDIEFKWLTRDEIKDFVKKDYYDNTEFLLDK